jgi:hypothetical protein
VKSHELSTLKELFFPHILFEGINELYGDMQNIDSPIACDFLYKLQMHYKIFDYGMVHCILGVTFVVVEY